MNTPIEVLEMSFPVRVEEYSILPDSGGAGRWRGGCGASELDRIVCDPELVDPVISYGVRRDIYLRMRQSEVRVVPDDLAFHVLADEHELHASARR